MLHEDRGRCFTSFTSKERKQVRYIVSDVDDTITSNGKLLTQSLSALWSINKSGLKTILITGGSAGWADTYIRQWPIDFVIAESGALLLMPLNDGDVLYKVNPCIDERGAREFKQKLLSLCSSCHLASDQYARLYDIAFDKKRNTLDDIKKIKNIVSDLGGYWAESSIHLNVWHGNYNKKLGLQTFLPYIGVIDEKSFIESSVYFGDSLNDQPLFEYFPLSVGMHSVQDNITRFDFLPKYITNEYGGFGFEKAIKNLLKK